MTTRDVPWAPGTPAWVELATSDRDAAWQFYGTVFGWTFADMGPQTGHYGLARLKGRDVAAVWQPGPEMGPPPPVAWTNYLASDDVDATAARIREHGGALLVEPDDVLDQGRMCLAQDPTGAVFGVWQAKAMIGAAIVNEPGAVIWNELLTRDTARAKDFYGAVFGYSFSEMEGDFDYATIDGDGPGGTVGGIGALSDTSPEVPSHWLTYFAVDDADTTAAAITAAGGRVLNGPFDSEFGRNAIVQDPQGGTFALIASPMGDPQAG